MRRSAPYSDARHGRSVHRRQIALVTTFADQAVIAIENVRLFDEVQARTEELTKSLQQQTATSEILASISGSMTDTQPVFDAIVRNLLRLFGVDLPWCNCSRDNGSTCRRSAATPDSRSCRTTIPVPLDDTTGGGLAMLSRRTVQFAPLQGQPGGPAPRRKASHGSSVSSPSSFLR